MDNNLNTDLRVIILNYCGDREANKLKPPSPLTNATAQVNNYTKRDWCSCPFFKG
jgi:hypothetical protein